MNQSAQSFRSDRVPARRDGKLLQSLEAAFDACEIRDGHVLSFHHHLRNGDGVAAMVMQVAARRGLRDLGVSISSLFPVHAPLVPLIEAGVVTRIWTDYAKGPVADAIRAGHLTQPALFQSHGGRARAIETGELKIDTAFIGAPVATPGGALTGAAGRAACGPLGYPMVDAAHARKVVAVVEDFAEELPRTDIDATSVDHIVRVPSIGDPAGILSGATRVAEDPHSLMIAQRAAGSIAACGHLHDGFSFQTGAGGISLATVSEIGTLMRDRRITGGFISGGICQAHVDLVRQGLFREIYDVQCFDQAAVESYRTDPWHHGMSAAKYASPVRPDAIVDKLDVMILGVSELDRDFNINVTTGGDGRIIGGPGGHPDTAAGARLRVAVTRLTGGGYPKLVNGVRTITTPGADVDLVVTDEGIAVNPARSDLAPMLQSAGLPVVGIDELIARAGALATRVPAPKAGPVVAHVERRTGGILDSIRGI
ncbi:MAG: citrate lyase subunit alpha [Rhodobiaceae bacterium]|nr:citrate lyase subunit alpha [Rhodobiaceae bacterium]MCC0040584.1 citrate lyase subunit alpha [Rhodobiaceae bacterium]